MYNVLAKYYDNLVKDDSATKSWVDLIKNNIQGKKILELACGSGEITIALANNGYDVDASDISKEMLKKAKNKNDADKVHFFYMDMNHFDVNKKYDGILCLCDSFNYLLHIDEVETLFKQVYNSLNENGVFIFDMHTQDRLVEFKDEFFEEGLIDENPYIWSIISEDDCIYHNFIFYDELANALQEQHIQKVYEPVVIGALLEPYFEVKVKTDFVLEGIQKGEKHFYIAKKRGK